MVSGKGYPNIESLKCISKFFSVTIDDLLSGEELPISSTGHMLLVDEVITLAMSETFKEMFFVVIQLGAFQVLSLIPGTSRSENNKFYVFLSLNSVPQERYAHSL